MQWAYNVNGKQRTSIQSKTTIHTWHCETVISMIKDKHYYYYAVDYGRDRHLVINKTHYKNSFPRTRNLVNTLFSSQIQSRMVQNPTTIIAVDLQLLFKQW